jgi:hypothetical protein
VLGRREAAGVDVEREQEAKEAARLVQDGLGDLLRPCLVAQAPPEECPIELVDGEVLEARILDDARVQLVQHVLELVAHELARHGALTAAHGVGTVERQGRLCRFPDARAVRDEAPPEHVALLVGVKTESSFVVVANEPVEVVPAIRTRGSGARTCGRSAG